jgi:hypothetical protein
LQAFDKSVDLRRKISAAGEPADHRRSMIKKNLTREFRMATRQMKMPEKIESEPEVNFSQHKRPELGRYLLQVDRQTKGSYQTVETAEAAGLAIKKEYPILHVTIYDSVECTSTALAPA